MIVSLSEDVLRAVPKSLREAAYALGANKYDVTAKVVVPAAFSGILASFLLAISRAVGETMAVALAAGLQPKLTLNPLDSVQTMTAFIVEVSQGDTPVGSLGYHTIFAVGLTLFAFTMSMKSSRSIHPGPHEREVRMNTKIKSNLFGTACLLATLVSVSLLFFLLSSIVHQGYSRLNWELITSMPSEFPERAGIKLAMVGSLWLICLTALIAVPIGVGTAIYLEEYARTSKVRSLIQLHISNLAGVPSVVYGILGLGLFVRALALDRSVLSGALTLSLVVLPIIILAAQEALKSVPDSIRNASYALGATRWQTIWRQVLPAATPAIMTGVILALSRAIGEAAPLLVVGAVGTATFLPTKLSDEFSALPIQIYNWAARAQDEFHNVAGSGIIVLMVMLICMNAVAVFVRYRFARKIQW